MPEKIDVRAETRSASMYASLIYNLLAEINGGKNVLELLDENGCVEFCVTVNGQEVSLKRFADFLSSNQERQVKRLVEEKFAEGELDKLDDKIRELNNVLDFVNQEVKSKTREIIGADYDEY